MLYKVFSDNTSRPLESYYPPYKGLKKASIKRFASLVILSAIIIQLFYSIIGFSIVNILKRVLTSFFLFNYTLNSLRGTFLRRGLVFANNLEEVLLFYSYEGYMYVLLFNINTFLLGSLITLILVVMEELIKYYLSRVLYTWHPQATLAIGLGFGLAECTYSILEAFICLCPDCGINRLIVKLVIHLYLSLKDSYQEGVVKHFLNNFMVSTCVSYTYVVYLSPELNQNLIFVLYGVFITSFGLLNFYFYFIDIIYRLSYNEFSDNFLYVYEEAVERAFLETKEPESKENVNDKVLSKELTEDEIWEGRKMQSINIFPYEYENENEG